MTFPRLTLLPVLLVMLAGCGSPPPPPKSARDEISGAERALASARQAENRGDLDLALNEYRSAREYVNKGKEFARNVELNLLTDMEKDVRKKITVLETKKETAPKPVAKPTVIAGAKAEDPQEKIRKAEEAKKKLDDAEAAQKKKDLAALYDVKDKPKAAKKSDDEEAEADPKPKTVAAKKQDGTKADDAEETAVKPAAKKIGPFPEVGAETPPLEIVKLEKKGKFAICYFQLYNKGNDGKRIGNVGVFFKNGNGQPMNNPAAAIAIPFGKFTATAANPYDQHAAWAITSGSHQITGTEALQLVGIAEIEKASEVQSVGVRVVFDDGTDAAASGPAGGAAAGAGAGLDLIKKK